MNQLWINGWMTIKQEGDHMKTCYMCHAKLTKNLVEVKVDNVLISDVPAEVCEQCGEQYFSTNTSTFIQKVAKYIKEQRKACTLEAIKT